MSGVPRYDGDAAQLLRSAARSVPAWADGGPPETSVADALGVAWSSFRLIRESAVAVLPVVAPEPAAPYLNAERMADETVRMIDKVWGTPSAATEARELTARSAGPVRDGIVRLVTLLEPYLEITIRRHAPFGYAFGALSKAELSAHIIGAELR